MFNVYDFIFRLINFKLLRVPCVNSAAGCLSHLYRVCFGPLFACKLYFIKYNIDKLHHVTFESLQAVTNTRSDKNRTLSCFVPSCPKIE